MIDEPQIDDILAEMNKPAAKKRINSCRKGKRGEREVVHLLMEHFKLPFAKRPEEFGSGGWSTTHEEVQEGLDLDHMAGDILVPKGFRFCIENKVGYDIEVINLFPDANRKRDEKLIDEFIAQAERDSNRVGKEPLVFYRKDYCPIITFFPTRLMIPNIPLLPILYYKNYTCVSLGMLLSYPRDFFLPGSGIITI